MTTPDVAAARLPWDAADPYPFYESRRRAGDVVWDEIADGWLILGYQAAREVLGGSGWTSDPLASPKVRGLQLLDTDLLSRNMLFADGANHTRLRGSVRDVFTPGFVNGLLPGVEAIAQEVIDHPPAGTVFDFMSDIALPLPVAVIGEWLGLDGGTSKLLHQQSPTIIRMLGALADPGEIEAGFAAFATLMTEFLPLAADRRSHPGEDLLSFIAGDPELLLDDVVVTAILIAIAGHETTANLLGAAMIRLLTADLDGYRIVDGLGPDDPIDPALVTELLRLDGPVQATIRTATEDQRIGDVEISAGQQALAVIAAANRDPAVYDQPETFAPGRAGPPPLAFGYGAHHCLGRALAQLEISVALRRILARKPELVGPVNWRDTPAIRGPLTMPMVFGG